MRNLKRCSVLILAIIVMAAFVLAGCENNSSSSKAGTIVKETADSITIVDQANREVTVPKEIKTVATSYRVTVRLVINLGEGDKISGIGKIEDFFYVVQPSIKKAADMGKGIPDLEAIAELKPTVFLYKASDVDGLENVEKLGIPAIGLSVETDEEVETAMTILGIIFGKQKRAEKLIAYYNQKIATDKELTADIKEKKTAIVMGATIGTVADGTMLQGHMIEVAGGVNAAADVKATELWPTAGTEQIFAWDPDYIFITGGKAATYGPEDIYKDKAWSELKAVKNKHVYLLPAEEDSWEFPGITSTIGIDYMMSKMYPEKMSEKTLQKNIDEFYKLAYGRTFSKEEIGY